MLVLRILVLPLLVISIVSGMAASGGDSLPEFSWGVSGGYAHFTYSSDLRALPSVNTVLPLQAKGSFDGFYAGGVLILPVTKLLSFGAGLFFYYETPSISATKNDTVIYAQQKVYGKVEHLVRTNMCNTRLEISARAALPFSFTVYGGFYAGYNHFNQNFELIEKPAYPVGSYLPGGNYEHKHHENEIEYRFNTGFITGIEYGIINTAGYSARLNVSYSLGMANVAENFDWDAYAVKAGIIILFHSFKNENPERPAEQMAFTSGF